MGYTNSIVNKIQADTNATHLANAKKIYIYIHTHTHTHTVVVVNEEGMPHPSFRSYY